jgi:uncharacterized membrane protein required for colicin V production
VTVDILSAAFLVLMTFFGWKRGLISQVVTLGSAYLLWFTRESWMGPVGNTLAKLGSAFADNFFLRDIASCLLLFGTLLLTVWIIEKKVVEKSGPLRFSNHWGGAVLGLAKGVLYATLLLWTIQTGVLWKQAPGERAPSWVSNSIAISVVDPWNPIRMFTLRELVNEMKTRASKAQTPREQALRKSTSLKDLVNAAKNDPEWATASYRKLLDDPRVQAIIADPELGDMLFGN